MYKILKGPLLLAMFITSNLITMQTFAGVCGIVTTSTNPLNIRKNSSQTAKVISTAARGSALNILNTKGAWHKIRLNNGTVGYGSTDYIKVLTSNSQETCGIVTTKKSPLVIREGGYKEAKIISKV
ncbi:SH3 domain-containing protein, partial [Thiotrichales bacterium HSG1]|nr:SH3 domain-containing protein [Thiotrichales bacterium HSG1]